MKQIETLHREVTIKYDNLVTNMNLITQKKESNNDDQMFSDYSLKLEELKEMKDKKVIRKDTNLDDKKLREFVNRIGMKGNKKEPDEEKGC